MAQAKATAKAASFVSYCRVSTVRQGKSGLGLESQRAAILSHIGSAKIAGEFVEVESGKGGVDRPQLTAALAACKLRGATLVIAKLDRLSRNVAFIAALMDSGVDFVACDFPSANRLTLHIMAAVAENERAMISVRTIAALAIAKKRGVILGNPAMLRGEMAGTAKAARKARACNVAKSVIKAQEYAALIERARASGVTTLAGIASFLTADHIPTSRGGTIWQAEQVRRVLLKLAA